MFDMIFQILVLVVIVAVVYMSFHIVDEEKTGKQKPFFWEKKNDDEL